MTSEDLRSQLEKAPFRPFRLHLVSGKTFDVLQPDGATLLQNTLLVLQDPSGRDDEAGHDIIASRNIERIEELRKQRSQ